MTYEHRDGQGSLFKNDKKGNPKAPDYRGDAKLSGEMYELAGWIKTGAKGNFLSIAIKKKGERQDAPVTRQVEPDDEPLPF